MGCAASTATAAGTPPTLLLEEENRMTRRAGSGTRVLTDGGAATADGGHACANSDDGFRSSVLPADLYAYIATFHCGIHDSTVMNMCLAAGLDHSTAFRQSYLANNMYYFCNNLYTYTLDDRPRLVANTRVWMTANPGWRQLIKPDFIEEYQRKTNLGEEEAAIHEVTSPTFLFNNSASAIMSGALEMLQYQVEVMNIDVNSFWIACYEAMPVQSSRSFHEY